MPGAALIVNRCRSTSSSTRSSMTRSPRCAMRPCRRSSSGGWPCESACSSPRRRRATSRARWGASRLRSDRPTRAGSPRAWSLFQSCGRARHAGRNPRAACRRRRRVVHIGLQRDEATAIPSEVLGEAARATSTGSLRADDRSDARHRRQHRRRPRSPAKGWRPRRARDLHRRLRRKGSRWSKEHHPDVGDFRAGDQSRPERAQVHPAGAGRFRRSAVRNLTPSAVPLGFVTAVFVGRRSRPPPPPPPLSFFFFDSPRQQTSESHGPQRGSMKTEAPQWTPVDAQGRRGQVAHSADAHRAEQDPVCRAAMRSTRSWAG